MNSSKVVVGHIPNKICYVYTKPETVNVGCEWDMDSGINSQTIKEEVLPAFPADEADPKHMATAISWAKYQNMMGLSAEERKNVPEPDSEIVENNSIKNVRILSVEHRGNGGRAYKAIAGKYYVDVREDVVMDTMLQVGIAPNGILHGEFVWAKCGSQMKLIRKGSSLYDLIVEFSAKKELKPIPKKNLEVGAVYLTRKKEPYMFIGNVNTVRYHTKRHLSPTHMYIRVNDDSNDNFLYDTTSHKNQMLFYKLYKHESYNKGIKEMLLGETYRFEFKSSHSLIEKIEQFTLEPDIVELISSAALKKVKENILEYLGKKPPKSGHVKLNKANLQTRINYSSDILNMHLTGTPPKELFDLKKYLLFS